MDIFGNLTTVIFGHEWDRIHWESGVGVTWNEECKSKVIINLNFSSREAPFL